MQNGNISDIEFCKVLQEEEKYRKLKTNIRNQVETKARHITKEQREELFKQERKERKRKFCDKLQVFQV